MTVTSPTPVWVKPATNRPWRERCVANIIHFRTPHDVNVGNID